MFKKWKLLSTLLLVILVLSLALTGCGDNKDTSGTGGNTGSTGNGDKTDSTGNNEEQYVIKYAHNQLESTPQHEGTLLFKEKVEELSNGRITVQIFPNNELGSMREVIEQVQSGQIELAQQSLSVLTNFAPELAVTDLPYLFPSEEVLWETLDGPMGDKLNGKLESAGLKALGYMSGGPKQFSSNMPIRTLADFKSQRFRALPAPIIISTFESLGINPIPIEFSELYNSLQQGVVDGQENPTQTVDMLRLYEVQKYVALTDHAWMIYNNVMNKDFFDKLPADLQEAVVEAMDYANVEQRKIMSSEEETYIKNIEANGCEVIRISDEVKADLAKATSVVEEQFRDTIGADLIAEFKAEIERLSK